MCPLNYDLSEKIETTIQLYLKLYYSSPNCGATQNDSKFRVPSMTSKEKDVFYLKLQWISAKDEAEKKQWAEKIKQVLSGQQN